MIIRSLTEKDVAQHDRVASQAFCFSAEIGDPASVLPCEKMLGAFDDDNETLFADLEIGSYQNYYGNTILTDAGIGGVASKPEHRGKGAVKGLFHKLFSDNEYDISILYPFSEQYYRNFGYESLGTAMELSVPFRCLSAIERNNNAVLYEGGNNENLTAIYARCASQNNLCFVRNDCSRFSDKPYTTQQFTYIWNNRGVITLSVDRTEKILNVYEFYYDSPETLKGMLGFLRNYESNQQTVCFVKLPENSPILFLLSDIKDCKISHYNIGSARVMNVEKVLNAHIYPKEKGSFTLEITDTFMNTDETFSVEYGDGSVAVTKGSVPCPDIKMNIAAASRVLLTGIGGYKECTYLPNTVINNKISDFFKAFPKDVAYFTDGF